MAFVASSVPGSTIATSSSETAKVLPANLDRTILIPMSIDAYVNYSPSQKVATDPRLRAYLAPVTAPNFDALKLDGDLVQHDIFEQLRDTPYMAAADRTRTLPSRQGVYIHWSLPKLYRNGIIASSTAQADLQDRLKKAGFPAGSAQDKHIAAGTPIFRPIPSRWLVARTISPGAARVNAVNRADADVFAAQMLIDKWTKEDNEPPSGHPWDPPPFTSGGNQEKIDRKQREIDTVLQPALDRAKRECVIYVGMPDGTSAAYGGGTEIWDLFVVQSVSTPFLTSESPMTKGRKQKRLLG